MLKPIILTFIITTPNYSLIETPIKLDGDYSEAAKRYTESQNKQNQNSSFDPNDILYRVIAREIEESGTETE